MKRLITILCALSFTSCFLSSEDHYQLDFEVGQASGAAFELREVEGRAAVRETETGRVRVWGAAPTLEFEFSGSSAIEIDFQNILPEAELTRDGVAIPLRYSSETRAAARIDEGTDVLLRLAAPDANAEESYRVAVLSDVQNAIDTVNDIFVQMAEDPTLRFVISTGDLVNNGTQEQLDRFQSELEALPIPFFSTVGNHEVPGPIEWHETFGPFSTFFEFKGVTYSLVDSSNATVHPALWDERVQPWLDANVDNTHIFLTHVPLFDPSGLRSGAFRSRNEAASIIARLAEARVDGIFFGHVHSFYAYSLGGTYTWISGGGGAIEERLDGIERHYLVLNLTPGEDLRDVSMVRVD